MRDESHAMTPAPRALQKGDLAAARVLLQAALNETDDFASLAIEYLDSALDASPEATAIVVDSERGIAGVAVFGCVAGALGAGRIYALAVDDDLRGRGIGTNLCYRALTALAARGARFVIVELPDAAGLARAKQFWERAGFATEARVPDFYRDGVDLLIMRRDAIR
jgi:ribosomal protein S18 acetylase RimI-like enzyme